MWDPVEGLVHVQVELRQPAARRGDPDAAVRRVRRRVRRLDDRGRALHERARQRLRLVPLAHARRPHEPLGPHLAALRPGRLPAQERSTASATTGRSPTTTSSRTTTRSIRLIGIFGTNLGRFRNEPDGIFHAAAAAALLRAADQAGVREAGHPVRPVAAVDPHASRSTAAPACHYCGQCGRGCATHSNFSSPSVLLPPAMATGKLTIIAERDGARSDGRRQRAGDRRRLHRQEHRCATTTSARASSCWRRARASRRASSSTRSRRSSRRAWRIRAAPSAST